MSTIIDFADHTFFISKDEDDKNTMWGRCLEAADDEDRSFGYFNICLLYTSDAADE